MERTRQEERESRKASSYIEVIMIVMIESILI